MKTTKSIYAMALFMFMSICFTSCSSDDDDELNFSNMTLVAGTTQEIKNGEGFSWTSSNEYIATVSDNTVEAKRVGTAIISSNEGKFTVTVKAQYDLYDEPCLEFGSSKSHIKSYMSDYTLAAETDNGLMYDGKGIEKYVAYIFENNAMKYSGVYIPTTYYEELASFLGERYVFEAYDDDNYIIGYKSIDSEMLILVTPQKLSGAYYYLVLYSEYDSTSSAPKRKEIQNVFGGTSLKDSKAKQYMKYLVDQTKEYR